MTRMSATATTHLHPVEDTAHTAGITSSMASRYGVLPRAFPSRKVRPDFSPLSMVFNRRMRRGFRLVKEKGAGKRRTSRPAGTSRRTRPVDRVSGLRLGGFQQPSFTTIPSSLLFGPADDIAMGWDGTLWAIDTSGAPHLFDPGAQQWNPYGAGVDAACQIGSTVYWFRQGQYATAGSGGSMSTPQPVATNWPLLPDSFKLGVHGAANVNGVLYVFNGGCYLAADGFVPRAMLTDLVNWPQTQHWAPGVIDAVYSDGSNHVSLFRGAEYITVDLPSKTVTTTPAPIANYPGWQDRIPQDWAATGIDAAFIQGDATVICKGPAVVTFSPNSSEVPTPEYIAVANTDWPAPWHPLLQHAPSGRMGNL